MRKTAFSWSILDARQQGKRLQNKSDAKTPFELILIARRLLIGDESITTEDITYWEPSKETHPDPIIHQK